MKKILNVKKNMKKINKREILKQKENMKTTYMRKILNHKENLRKTNLRKILNQKEKMAKKMHKKNKRCLNKVEGFCQQIRQSPISFAQRAIGAFIS